MLRIISLLLALFLYSQISTASIDVEKAKDYLRRYGYLDESHGTPDNMVSRSSDESQLKDAISQFQINFGLSLTGRLDKETEEAMEARRCGVKDIIRTAPGSRFKRYKLKDGRFYIGKHLTYSINNYPSQFLYYQNPADKSSAQHLDSFYVDQVIQKAFDAWSNVTNLKFTRLQSPRATFQIRFGKGRHRCYEPFDGKGNVLAHAWGPGESGDVHFDDDEPWTYNSRFGVNLLRVAAHEFGHSLGLAHCFDSEDILMYPTISKKEYSSILHSDDIAGIQHLYGAKTVDLCESGNIDAIFKGPNADAFIFKDKWYWEIMGNNMISEPRPISEGWPGLPTNIDAAFTFDRNGKTYFFKGSQYWRYTGNMLDSGYPKLISQQFKGVPNNIDAVLRFKGSKNIYFFKGSYFYRYNVETVPPAQPAVAEPITLWRGLPSNLDAAFENDNGLTYFFKGGNYWRFNRHTSMVDQPIGQLPYPRSALDWWFGCNQRVRQNVKNISPNIIETNHLSSNGHYD